MSANAVAAIRPTHATDIYPIYANWKGIVPFPPGPLLWSVGGATLEEFLVVGDAWCQLISRFTPEDATVVDIGCGCGRTARFLMNNPWVKRYIGFDVIPSNIEWCNNFLAPAWRNHSAEFHHFDLYSGEYNPEGEIKTTDLKFPCQDGGADVIIAVSVFTHLLEADAKHYLKESRRILSGRGHAIFSIHTQVVEGKAFQGTEARIDVSLDYFLQVAKEAGLQEAARHDDLAGQQVLIFRRM